MKTKSEVDLIHQSGKNFVGTEQYFQALKLLSNGLLLIITEILHQAALRRKGTYFQNSVN